MPEYKNIYMAVQVKNGWIRYELSDFIKINGFHSVEYFFNNENHVWSKRSWNRSVVSFLRTDAERLLIIGANISPSGCDGSLHDILMSDKVHDVVSARTKLSFGGPHSLSTKSIHRVHNDVLLLSRKCLQAIEPPWFFFKTNDKGTQVTECPCRWFSRKIKEAGIVPLIYPPGYVRRAKEILLCKQGVTTNGCS